MSPRRSNGAPVRLPHAPAPEPTPIEQAIERVAAREQPEGAKVVTLPILPAMRFRPGGSLTLAIPPSGVAVLMVVDPASGGWRPVLLPAGSRWELREARPHTGLILPGGARA